ncbi:MAG: hypothetical protein AAB646_01805 [Patescibacteria group bacterium]
MVNISTCRKADQDYAIWVRDRVEADEELKNKSADDLKASGTNCIILEERLMLEFFYYWKNKSHLDIQNVTLCAGSRYSDGGVPEVRWDSDDGEVCVRWLYSCHRDFRLRSRAAVS